VASIYSWAESEGLPSLYADDAVLESTAVLVLEGHTDGVLTGKEALTQHFASFFASCQRSRQRSGIAQVPGSKTKMY
jgi:hypothetical protein